MKGGFFLNSGILFGVAVSAYERLKAAPADKAGGQNDALVAILFSAATLEAFVTELALMAQSDAALFGHKPLQSVAAVLKEAEASRGSVRLKFLLAKARPTTKDRNRIKTLTLFLRYVMRSSI